MYTVWQNGTISDSPLILEDIESFYIQQDQNIKYYKNDEFIHELEMEISSLYDNTFHYYVSPKEHYEQIWSMPIWLSEAGLSSHYTISRSDFSRYIQEVKETDKSVINRWLIGFDYQFLASTISSLVQALEYCFLNYYKQICKINPISSRLDDGVFQTSGELCYNIIMLVETFFTKAYSVLDIVCKIAYEIDNKTTDFSSYKKLKCSEVLWGDRKKLKRIERPGTLFEDSNMIHTIESIRNEVVHNGTWEYSPTVYLRIENREVIERFALFPDLTDGRVDCVKNRRHFFGIDTKINEILPQIYFEFMSKLLNTVKMLNSVLSLETQND